MNTLYTFKKQLLLTVLFFIGSTTALVAQTAGIPFQAYIMDTNSGNVPGYQLPIPMVNAEILLEFTIQNSVGEVEYIERQTVITDAFGMVSTYVGTDPTNAYSKTFSSINWNGFSKKLITRIDFTNTGDQFEPHHEMDIVFIPGPSTGSSGAILGTTPPDDGVEDPVDPVAGAIYLDTTTGDLYVFDGTDWVKPNSTPDDTSSPAVAGVSISATDAAGAPKSGALDPGDRIVVTVSMNEVVMVDLTGGVPTYTIDVGGVPRTATYVSGSTTTDLVFSYTVSEGDVDTAGGVTAAAGSDALDLDGATLLDAAGNAANTSTPAVSDGDNSIVVDAAGPMATKVAIKGTNASGADKTTTLGTGDKIVVTVTLDEAATVDTSGGTPTYTINVGGVDKTATYVSGTGTTSLVFSYTIASGDSDTTDGITAGTSALAYAGGIMEGIADGRAVALATPEVAAAANSIVVDATGPAVTAVAIKGTDASDVDKTTTLGVGDKIVVTATMNEATTVDTAGGTPTYTIDVGGVSKTATYVSGTGTTALVFSYTIVSGDNDSADGITAGTTALALAGGTLKDAVGNDATLATPEVVAADNAVAVDTTAPTVSSVAIKGTDASDVDKTTDLEAGDKIVVTVTMDEATTVVTTGGIPTYTINVGGVDKAATYVSGSGTTALVFSYTVANGDTDDTDGITAGTTALALAGGTLKDAVGNDAALTTPEVVATTNTIVVDAAGPEATAVAIKGTNASGTDKTTTLGVGDKIVVTVTMDEATTVVTTGGIPTYTIDVGGVDKTATYVSGTGTTSLVFSYTIASGDSDTTDGITAGTGAMAYAGGIMEGVADGRAVALATPEIAAGANSIVVDAAGPEVDRVSMKGTNASDVDKTTTLGVGDKIVVTATMNEATTVDTAGGTPTYTIDVGGVSKTATYVSGTGTTALVFSYTILPGDEDIADGITAGTAALALAGGTLKDAVGNNAVLTTPEVVAGDNTIVVDMVLTAAADSSVAENAAYTSTAPSISGNDPSGTITYSLTGADAGDFTVNATTGVVSMVARDFETPADADMDNVYNYTLVATDTGGDTATDAVVVTVTNVVVEMTLTAAADSSVAENAAYTSAAPTLGGDAPVGTVTYTLSGDDAGDFTVNASTGVVSMVARDFENPADADTDNVYNYTLVVTDTAGNTASDAVVVTVTNVAITLTAAADSSVAENAAYTSAAPTLGGDATSGTVTYTLTGADAAQFTVNASTGVVSMVGRDFENPADAGTNNVYNYNLVATATGGDTASDAVVVTVTNRLEIDVTLAGPRLVLRDSAATNTTVASFSTDDGTATVAFTPGSNVDGYYNISGTNVRLTAAGATFAFGGGVLPAISLTVTDATDSAKTDVDTATPVVSALPLDLADMTVPCDGCRNQGSYSVAALFDDVVSSGTNGYLTNAKTFRPVFNTPLEIDYILFGKTSNSQFINGSVLTAYADAARTIPIDLTLTTLVADNPDFLTIVGGQVEINGHNATTDVVLDFSGVTTLINAISLTGSDTSYMLFSEFDVYLKP